MAYSDFTLLEVKAKFNLRIEEPLSLFSGVMPATVSPLLAELLKNWVPLAHAIATEKARSEFIIAPVLAEVRSLLQNRISLFSGIAFNVDPKLGLTGICDFMLSRSAEQLVLDTPIVAVVEARNENINAGLPQCMAELVACRLFNERQGSPVSALYGCVTTGTIWKFLKYLDNAVVIDIDDYYIREVDRILGIFKSIFICA